MADEKKRDWIDILDIIAKLLIPVAIALGGALYSAHQGKVDRERLAAERQDENTRRNLERDTGYVRMLVSGNEHEKNLGIGIIDVLSRKNKFSPDLLAALNIIAGGAENDTLTQAAKRVLAKQQQVDSAKTSNSAIDVYIQISKHEQGTDAEALQNALRKEGFASPEIELVAREVAPVNTYIRFFAAPGALQASRVKDVMSKLGYKSAVQDFSAYAPSPLSYIEIWIGKNQDKLPKSSGT